MARVDNPQQSAVRLLPEGFVKHIGGVRRASWDLMDALRDRNVSISIDPWLDRSALDLTVDAPSTARRAFLQARSVVTGLRASLPESTAVAHALYYDPSALITRGPLVVTVYDMIHERFGSGSGFLRTMKRLVVERADVVVAISRATADDVREILPGSPDVVVIYPGISKMLLEDPLPDGNHGRRGALFVGNRHRHKNFRLLLDAYRSSIELRELPLVLVGGSPLSATERNKIESVTGQPITHHRHIDDTALRDLYDGAAVTVVPSTWEGFGLPVLEAMARGCPVACSGVGSLIEIAGGHAALLDPDSPEACADAMLRAANTPLTSREDARRHAEHFSWAKAAEAHLALYGSLSGSPDRLRFPSG